MKKYKCLLCGYVYDPAVGDPDNGVEAGTAFEDLPDEAVQRQTAYRFAEYNPLRRDVFALQSANLL